MNDGVICEGALARIVVPVPAREPAVRDTLERACAHDSPPCPGVAGTGLGSYGGGHLAASRFLVTRNALCGVQLAHGGDGTGGRYPEGETMDLHDGDISFNGVCGANVQTEGFDIRRLTDRVWYHDNPTELDMSELPVPGITVGME